MIVSMLVFIIDNVCVILDCGDMATTMPTLMINLNQFKKTVNKKGNWGLPKTKILCQHASQLRRHEQFELCDWNIFMKTKLLCETVLSVGLLVNCFEQRKLEYKSLDTVPFSPGVIK